MKKRWIAAAAALCAVVVAAIALAQWETPAPVIQKNTESSMLSSALNSSSVPSVSEENTDAFNTYMDQKAGEIRRAKNLAYDEGVIFEEQGLFWEVDGAHELTGLAAVQKQYPQAALKAEYHGYRFSSLTIDYQSGQREWYQVENPKHATGEVFRRDVSLRSAYSIMAGYAKGENLLYVEVKKRQYPLNEIEPEDILTGDRSDYLLLKLPTGSYYGFCYLAKKENYTIQVTAEKSRNNVAESLFPQLTISGTEDERTTRQGILNLLDTLDVKGGCGAILQQYGLQ